MQNLRQPFQFDRGIVRFEENLSFVTEAVYTYSESLANGKRKSPSILKKSVGFQPNTVSFASFRLL